MMRFPGSPSALLAFVLVAFLRGDWFHRRPRGTLRWPRRGPGRGLPVWPRKAGETMGRSRILGALLLWGGVTTLGTPAGATVVQELTLEDMAAGADAIVLARVVRVLERVVLTDRGAVPQRIARLRVTRWLKGRGAALVEVRETGGRFGHGGGMAIAGVPRYRAGQEVLLFLERRAGHASAYRTYAMAQGTFVVRRGVPGVQDVVRRDLRDLGLAAWSQGRFRVRRREGVEEASLHDVLARIERVVRWLEPRGSSPVGGRLR